MTQNTKDLKLLDRDRQHKPKTYKVRKAGFALVVDVPSVFLARNKIKVGAGVYRYMDDDGNLVISPRLLTEED